MSSSHVYGDPGVYIVTVTVTDNDGESHSDSLTLFAVHGFLGYCGYAETKNVKVEDRAVVGCSVGGFEKTEIRTEAFVDGDVISFEEEVKVEDFVQISGSIIAKKDVEVSDNSTVGLNVESLEDVLLKKNVTVGGDVSASRVVKLESGASVAGTITENANVILLPKPTELSVSVSAGSADVKVDQNITIILPPGNYGKLKIEEGGTLILSAGQYNFKEIETRKEANISIDLSTAPNNIIIGVNGKVVMDDRTQMNVLGGGNAVDIMFVITGDSIELRKEGSYLGTFIAPWADIKMEEKGTLEGMLYGQKVELKKEIIMTGAPAIDLFADYFIKP